MNKICYLFIPLPYVWLGNYLHVKLVTPKVRFSCECCNKKNMVDDIWFSFITDWIQSLKSFVVDQRIVNAVRVRGNAHSTVPLRDSGR